MLNPHIIGLMNAYGMEVQYERPKECKTRFSGNGTFVDVWVGRRGITMAVYRPEWKSCEYHHRMSQSKIEDVLISVSERAYAN